MPEGPSLGGGWGVLGALAALVGTLGVVLVHPHAFLHFVDYALIWHVFIFAFHRQDLRRFSFAFAANSYFIAIFYFLQTSVYPESYGTTSPLGSWTDDYYFFALAADSIPPGLALRENFQLYTAPFSSLIQFLALPAIDHPMDAVFFQSGTAAMLATFLRRFVIQLSGEEDLARNAYVFAIICPFLMMNGGVILIRDTLAAALLIYSLSCLLSRRFVLAGAAVALQFAVRPGSALLLAPVYLILFHRDVTAWARRHPAAAAVTIGSFAVGAGFLFVRLSQLAELADPIFSGTALGGAVGFFGRELITDLVALPGRNQIFLTIQAQVFPVRFFLGALYIFQYPFLTPSVALAYPHFDVRSVTLNVVVPIYAFWLNAWFIAGAVTRTKVVSRQNEIVFAALVSFLLIGTYSLQTRHKTMVYALYYLVVAIGFTRSRRSARQLGYVTSALFMMVQVALILR